MKFLNDFYICCGCHQLFDRKTKIHLFNEENQRIFCSEICTENFYHSLMGHLALTEKKIRSEMKLPLEPCGSLIQDQEILEVALQRPDEVHSINNGLGETVHLHFLWHEHVYYGKVGIVLYCLKEQKRPFLILHTVLTQNKELIEKLLPEKHSEEEAHGPADVFVDEETATSLENKKSQLMATLLERQSPMDIPFEEFHKYENHLAPTLENPDEVFSEVDAEGDQVFKFFKACNSQGNNFYYIVVGVIVNVDEENLTETIVPILSFPTIDGELYRSFKTGQQVSGPPRS
ncbi:MAG: hypothetical protein HYV97_08565 [Bdellovibrio sp.]|nr:hypothetical protein [Bdellovibrio sp.]